MFSLFQINQPDPQHSIEVEVGVVVENLAKEEYNIKVQGTYEFSGQEHTKMELEIPGFDKIIDSKQLYFDDKKSSKEFKIRVMIVVKSVRLCDSVELLDLYNFDPAIHDIEVNVLGHNMCLSKKLIDIQSASLGNLIETKLITESSLPTGISFDTLYLFFQILHGVDIALDKTTIQSVLQLSQNLNVPRVTEYCKTLLVKGCHGLNNNETANMAVNEFAFWDILPLKLHEANSLKELKEQNWELDNLPESSVDMIIGRMYELNC
uniref:BTB domain-containing protein n=1 Tax=Caenorhabditis tropicalis TaxID=1561998 RepID=A0A1I7UV10_9PELO